MQRSAEVQWFPLVLAFPRILGEGIWCLVGVRAFFAFGFAAVAEV